MKTKFLVSGLGNKTIILGLPWLQQHNPDIDWEKGMFEFRTDPMWVRICTIAVKTWAMMKGMPFEERRLRMVKLPKPTIEEVTDEEPPPITNPDAEWIGPQDHPLIIETTDIHPIKEPSKLSKPESEPETELKSVDLEELPNLEEGKLLITYLKGEPIISILEQGQSLLTKEFEEPTFSYSWHTGKVSWLAKFLDTRKSSFTSNIHIHAKTSVSQTLTHGSEKDNEAKRKSFEELVPEQYHDYKKVFEKAASECFPES